MAGHSEEACPLLPASHLAGYQHPISASGLADRLILR